MRPTRAAFADVGRGPNRHEGQPMRGIIAGSVGLALGLGVVPARAADAPWRPPAAPAPAVVWGAPPAAPAPRQPLASLGVPLATLDAPRAAGSGPALDPAVRPAA